MAKRCVICKQKLSESLFTSHPLKCDECWTKELKPVKKASEGVKRSFVKHEPGIIDETTSTSYMKPLKKKKEDDVNKL